MENKMNVFDVVLCQSMSRVTLTKPIYSPVLKSADCRVSFWFHFINQSRKASKFLCLEINKRFLPLCRVAWA